MLGQSVCDGLLPVEPVRVPVDDGFECLLDVFVRDLGEFPHGRNCSSSRTGDRLWYVGGGQPSGLDTGTTAGSVAGLGPTDRARAPDRELKPVTVLQVQTLPLVVGLVSGPEHVSRR